MKLSAPVFRLKKQAKRLSRETKAPLHTSLDAVAAREGFRNWGHLSSASSVGTTAADLLTRFAPGEFVLIGARPGQGKTMLAINLAAEAARTGRDAYIFSLEETEKRIAAWTETADRPVAKVNIDTSDEISAAYIVDRLHDAAKRSFIVVDYLQILDQRRDKPPLDEQLALLADFVCRREVTMAFIAQIDRHFEDSGRVVPDLSDVRLPNSVDLGLFAKFCFLHGGTLSIQ